MKIEKFSKHLFFCPYKSQEKDPYVATLLDGSFRIRFNIYRLISKSLDFELFEFMELIFQISSIYSIFSKSKPDSPARFPQFVTLIGTTPLRMAGSVLFPMSLLMVLATMSVSELMAELNRGFAR